MGLSSFDMEALDYFENATNKIISGRSTESSEQKDFVQLCRNHMVDDPKPSDPDTKIDKFGISWTTKGMCIYVIGRLHCHLCSVIHLILKLFLKLFEFNQIL